MASAQPPAPEARRPRRNQRLRILAEAAGVYILAWLYLENLQFLTPYIPGTDAYFHIKFSWTLHAYGLSDTLHWATQSLWTERFYDNSLGFHLAMLPFTFGEDLATGGKLGAVTLGAGVFASFYTVLRLRRIPLAGLWVFLLVASGGYFIWRVSMPRPHLLALVFSLWSLYFVVARNWIGTAITGALYSFSYLAPMLPVYAAIHAFFCVVVREPFPKRTLAAAFGGVALGWVLHPHFLSNFSGWVPLSIWIPVKLLFVAWGLGGPALKLGGEGSSLETDAFLFEHLVIFLGAWVSVFVLSQSRRRLTADLLSVVGVAVSFFVGACLTVRFIEYFVPFGLWACAEIVGPWLGRERERTPIRSRRFGIAVATIVALAGLLFAYGDHRSRLYLSHPKPSKTRAAAEWLARNSPPDSVVFTCDWDDPPELFFYNHANRYLVFLDPIFMYGWNPERWRTWRAVTAGDDPDPAETIRTTFEARFGYCTNSFGALQHQLESDPRVRIPFRTNLGYVFEITG